MRYDPNDPNALTFGFAAESYEEYLRMCNALYELYPVIKAMSDNYLDVPLGHCFEWDELQRKYDECHHEWAEEIQKQLDEDHENKKVSMIKFKDFGRYPASIQTWGGW